MTRCIGQFKLLASRTIQTTPNRASHVVIALVVQHVAHKQSDSLVSQVLPPMGGAAGLWPYLASFVQNGNRAVTGIFDDLAFRDVDDGGSIAVTVPRHDAAWLDSEFAEPELTPLDVCLLLFKINRGEHRVGYALAGVGNRLTSVDPAIMPARTRCRPKRRASVMPSNMLVVSSVKALPKGGRNGTES